MTKRKPPHLKEKQGRPTIMTPDIIDKLEQAFSLGASDLEACLHAGIGKSTLYNYQNQNPSFVERKELLKDKLILKSRAVLAAALGNNDKQTAQWYLERKRKEEFSVRTEANVSGGFELKLSDLLRTLSNNEPEKDEQE